MISHRAGLQVTALREIPDDPTFRDEWNALVSRTHSPRVFYTYEWARAVQLAYGESLCPLLLLARDENQQLIGVAALAAPERGPVSFLCATTGDYCDFVVSEEHAAVFVDLVFETLRQQGRRDIVLTNLLEDSPSYFALRGAARAKGFHIYARTAYECAQVRLREAASDNIKLSLPRQRMVRRSLKGMGDPLTMTQESVQEQISERLPEFFRAHIARFFYIDRISNMLRPERRRFLSELAELLSSTGWLRLTRLNVGTRTVAWHYGFAFRGTWFLYQATFVSDLEKHSPGFVLLFKMVEEAAQDPSFQNVDLGLGTEAYKESFANDSRRTMYVTLHRSRFKHLKEMARYKASQAIRARPRAERVVRDFAAKVSSLRQRLRQDGVWSTFTSILLRMRRWAFSREEAVFFEAAAVPFASSGKLPEGLLQEDLYKGGLLEGQFSLRPVTYELLAEAAMQSPDDDHALQYFLGCARRMRQGKGEGFALVDHGGTPLHFVWSCDADRFFQEKWKSSAPIADHNTVVLFDAWTPPNARGCGHSGRAIRLVADKVRQTGRRAWIFVTNTGRASDAASIPEIEQAGFERRYSLIRQTLFGVQTIEGQKAIFREAPPAEVSASI